eukprot:gnl/MRDRNA2_/MRDRNA2_107731_c0_seq1.p1 gnl/MRDRNA2_/MRDRNA2_107731_c0~~gnl/MRDRNA2_/MRDRNA2_107731_c0_seq1.p1  ORF type:complete len:366 (-),score=68.70 gnl/MRDRNA2_/MRDRNA2_107731_c0_seq1:133-1230(-)
MRRTILSRIVSILLLLPGVVALVERRQAMLASSLQGNELSVDLVHASQQLLSFLKAVHTSTKGELYKASPTLDCAIRRYKSGWIPLLKQLSADADMREGSDPIDLVPPTDIAWVWHVHRLHPTAYAEFSKEQSINHEVFDGAFHQQSSTSEHSGDVDEALATQDMWKKLHGSKMPFFMNTATHSCDAPNALEDRLPSSFLEAASVRQSKFLWNFLTPNYDDQEFLKGSEGRYVRWLQLKEKNPREHLVPTVPIDLMWHSHMLVSPLTYTDDIHRMGMKQLGHDDSSPKTILRPRFERTLELWDKAYAGTEFSKMVVGAPLRGEPSRAYWSGSLDSFQEVPMDDTSFLQTNMEDGDCMSACSDDMR